MTIPKKLALTLAVVAVVTGATNVLGSTLTLIPIPPWLAGTNDNQGRAITVDGKYVVGVSGTSTEGGFLYDVANNTLAQPNAGGAVPSVATGVAYRTDPVSSQKQLVIDGLSSGYQTDWMTANGGSTWGAQRRDTAYAPNRIPAANSLAAVEGSDRFYQIVRSTNDRELYTNQGSNTWDNATAPTFINNLSVNLPNGVTGNMNGVAPNGRAVGQRRVSNVRNNYVIEYPPNDATAFFFNGLDGTSVGEAFSISADGNSVFGRSPITGSGATNHGYKVINPGPSQTIGALPHFPNTDGSTSLDAPYGCTPDGRYASGMNFRGTEKAVLWDTGDPNPANWTVTDLTDQATSEGILGGFTRLSRGYSVGTNSAGYPVITGIGSYFDGVATYTRGFVMVLSPATPAVARPRITSITGAGTGSVTVNYTNTLTGTNYTLQYNTNLNSATWTTVGSQAAPGTSDSQTDASANTAERYYRVYYVTP